MTAVPPAIGAEASRRQTPGGAGAAVELAPMEGVTEFPFRIFMHLANGPIPMTTPFLRVTASHPAKKRPPLFMPERVLGPEACPWPLMPQLMATDAADLVRTARLPDFLSESTIEVNCGCPSPIVSGKGAGSGLLKDPRRFAEFLGEAATGLGPGRLAVKMRTGYACASEFERLLPIVAGLPLARVTVHGRTRAQGYGGKARWDLATLAATRLPTPVYASGDILSHGTYGALLGGGDGRRLAGVLIGRGALRNPWIFREIRTRTAVVLPVSALLSALRTYTALHRLWIETPETLIQLAASGLFRHPPGIDPESWSALADRLTAALAPAGTLEGRTLGRLKLLWHYLRSSLPTELGGQQLLRARAPTELIGGIAGLLADTESVTFVHDAAWDRLYGRGKAETDGAAAVPAS